MAADKNILEKLFGSSAKVRLLRLFMVNPDAVYDAKEITKRIGLAPKSFSRDLRVLVNIGYVKRSARGFALVKSFLYLSEVAQLLASAAPRAREKLLARMKGAGKINLVVIAGRLVNDTTRTADVFIVGDNLKKVRVEQTLKSLEGDIGSELLYATMPTAEFQYRYGLFDRFLKELFDNPHEIIFNKLGI